MSLIEQAAKRLEELRRAGAELPESDSQPAGRSAPATRPAASCRRPKPLPSAIAARADAAVRTGARRGRRCATALGAKT